MWVQSLCQENPPEKKMATYSSILACKIPWTEGPGGLQTMGLHRVRHDLVPEHTHRCQYRLTDCTKQMYPLCRKDDDGKAVNVSGQRMHEKFLYFLLDFAVNKNNLVTQKEL